jgi:hypothetical protein
MSMKNKFEAVKVDDPDPNATGWEVKTKQGGMWYTICDTYCADGKDAQENAERIACLLNGETHLTVSQLVLVKDLVGTILADGDLRRGFGAMVSTRELNALLRTVDEQITRKL